MGEDFNITGTWVNRMTGDKITVRNAIIDGDDMIITASDGRQLSMVEFQNYIQMSDDNKSGNADIELGDIRSLENERRVVVGVHESKSTLVNNPYAFDEKHQQRKQEPKNKEISESEKLLNKLFEKIELNINVKLDLDCNNFPVKELNMLQMIYDVSTDDISNYIIKNVINEEVFKSAVSEYIAEQLTKK